jgi:predicted Zn-dependent protease
MKRIFSIFILLLVFVGCAKVPLTNRKQISMIPNNQLMASSFTSYDQVLSDSKLSNNTEQVQMIKRVGNNIKNAVETYLKENNQSEITKDFEWEFNLIEENTINAWCMPGGKVAFYTGILPVCEDEAGVAVVMGHEVAHAIANHGGERMSQALIQQAGGVALAVALQEQPQQTQALAMAAYTGGSTIVGMLPFSRLHESEADELGLYFMAMAGYDPAEAPEFWKRMSKGGSSTPEFLSTHPSGDTRIKKLNENMPKAMKFYKASKKATNKSIGDVELGEESSKKKSSIKMKIDN